MLEPADYARLLRVDSVPRLLGALADTDYGPDVEAAMTRGTDLRRLDDMLKRHAIRRLGSLPGMYEPPERHIVELLLVRHDLENLLTIIRGHANRQGSDVVLDLTLALGRITAAELRELARAPGLRAAIDLMVAWGIPSQATARRILAAWATYESGRDPVVLEHALQRAYAEHLDTSLSSVDGAFAEMLRIEVDQRNVLIALRLRQARSDGDLGAEVGDTPAAYPVGGRIRAPMLVAVSFADSRAEAAQVLARSRLPVTWGPALEAWVEHGDLVRLADDLTTALVRLAVGLFAAGDPLGIDIPAAFTWAKEAELRNLRWIGRGLAHHLSAETISERIVMP